MKVAMNKKNAIIIGSDEIAVSNKKIFGKPIRKETAIKQLKYISNRHVIFKTGLCVIDTLTRNSLSLVNYKVKMRKLNIQEIKSYIKKEDSLNCAASIKIEGLAISLIEKTSGVDPTSVIGLPLIKLREYLNKLGVSLP